MPDYLILQIRVKLNFANVYLNYLLGINYHDYKVVIFIYLSRSKSKGRGRKTWNECMKVDMIKLGLVKDDAHNRDKWRSLTTGNRPTLTQCGL